MRSEKGASVIELTLILPLVFYFLAGMTDAVAVGVQDLALWRAGHAAIEEMKFSGEYDATAQVALQNTLTGEGVDPAKATVSNSTPQAPGGAIWVSLSENYAAPFALPGMQASYPVAATASGEAF